MTQTKLNRSTRYEQCKEFCAATPGFSRDEFCAAQELEKRVTSGRPLRVAVSRYHEGQMSQPVIEATRIEGGVYVELRWTNTGYPPVCTVVRDPRAADIWLAAHGVKSPDVGAA